MFLLYLIFSVALLYTWRVLSSFASNDFLISSLVLKSGIIFLAMSLQRPRPFLLKHRLVYW